MTIAENLKKYIDMMQDEINRNDYCSLTFKIQDGKFVRLEKNLAINVEDIKIEITDQFRLKIK